MEGRPPMKVFKEYAVPKREIPDHLKKYLFTMRYIKTVQRNGIYLDNVYFQHKDFINYNGKKVEVRRPIDNAGIVHIFSIPDRVYLFDAEYLPDSGIAQEEIQKKKKLLKEMKELEKKYNRKKAEYDKGVFKTPAESYAETYSDNALKVVGGEPLADNAQPNLKLVKPVKKKYKGLFDVD